MKLHLENMSTYSWLQLIYHLDKIFKCLFDLD